MILNRRYDAGMASDKATIYRSRPAVADKQGLSELQSPAKKWVPTH
jgi:hypothetical protein